MKSSMFFFVCDILKTSLSVSLCGQTPSRLTSMADCRAYVCVSSRSGNHISRMCGWPSCDQGSAWQALMWAERSGLGTLVWISHIPCLIHNIPLDAEECDTSLSRVSQIQHNKKHYFQICFSFIPRAIKPTSTQRDWLVFFPFTFIKSFIRGTASSH